MTTNMQVSRIRDQVDKPKITISAVKRSASCSHGWLRWTVQCIFGAITIISFILIVYMAIFNTTSVGEDYWCTPHGCRIVCHDVPFYDSHLNDLAYAVREAESNCPHVIVVLNDPMFSNHTIPRDLVSNLRSNINELEIIGGNMKFIAPDTFMYPFAANIERLHFRNVMISNWVPESLIGLTNLKEIVIDNCRIYDLNRNALEAVDNTLTTLTITESGYWHPTNLTGGSNLEVLRTVYLSYNNFNNILNRNSFSRLKRCKVLYLDSCRINAIGRGTFDYLDEIEKLFLNNNFLILLPSNLFSKIMTINNPRPRVNLLNNLWYCDCTLPDLHNLSASGILLVDPPCFYPSEFRGLTFSELALQCSDKSNWKTHFNETRSSNNIDVILAGNCSNDQRTTSLISPSSLLKCSAAQYKVARTLSRKKPPPNNNSRPEQNSSMLLKARFAVQSDSLSIIAISSAGSPVTGNFGLLWYQTDCPEELYCINTLPNNLHVFNVENSTEYTFCPILLRTGEVVTDQCVIHALQMTTEITVTRVLQISLYIFSAILGTVIGACILYTVIRKFPYLLKGSDRILFVKHKNVDALVLPPKVPLRESVIKDYPTGEINNVIFTLSDSKVTRNPFVRMKSTRSNKSVAPSYISAVQPTEEQLTEWRLRHHFDNNLTITSVGFDVPYSLLFDNESTYCSIGQASTDNYYESLDNKV